MISTTTKTPEEGTVMGDQPKEPETKFLTYTERTGTGKDAKIETATQEVETNLAYDLLDRQNSKHREATDEEIQAYKDEQKERRDAKEGNQKTTVSAGSSDDTKAAVEMAEKAEEQADLATQRAEAAEAELAAMKKAQENAAKENKPSGPTPPAQTDAQKKAAADKAKKDKDAKGNQNI